MLVAVTVLIAIEIAAAATVLEFYHGHLNMLINILGSMPYLLTCPNTRAQRVYLTLTVYYLTISLVSILLTIASWTINWSIKCREKSRFRATETRRMCRENMERLLRIQGDRLCYSSMFDQSLEEYNGKKQIYRNGL